MDIAFARSRLARHTKNPTQHHLNLLKHCVKFIKHTPQHGILYQDEETTQPLTGYVDADYAESADRKYTSGHIELMFGAPKSWASKKKDTIALSTCEAE